MHIRQSGNKFLIQNLTFAEMTNLYNWLESCEDVRECVMLRQKIHSALLESLDEDEIQEEFGYGKEQYLKNIIN